MPQMPIPDDWDGETYDCVLIDWPSSVQWFAILRGFVTTPLRGRFWDASTGSILAVQAIGREIAERNPIVSCQDIVTALQGIQAAVESLDTSQAAQITIQTNIENNINALSIALSNAIQSQSQDLVAVTVSAAVAQAQAFAWSQSFAQAIAPVTVINNFSLQLRPIDTSVDPPPTAEEETETGISSTTEPMADVLVCRRVTWMVIAARSFFQFLDSFSEGVSNGVLDFLGLISDGIEASKSFDGSLVDRFLIPVSALLGLAYNLAELSTQDLYSTVIADLATFFTDDFDDIRFNLFCAISLSNASTSALQDVVVNTWTTAGGSTIGERILRTYFSLSLMATLYFVAPALDTAPPIPIGMSECAPFGCE